MQLRAQEINPPQKQAQAAFPAPLLLRGAGTTCTAMHKGFLQGPEGKAKAARIWFHRDNHDLERERCLSPFMQMHIMLQAPSPGTPWDMASRARLDSALQSGLTLQPRSTTPTKVGPCTKLNAASAQTGGKPRQGGC